MLNRSFVESVNQSSITLSPAPLWRRLAAMLYDGLIVLALMMLATAVALPLNNGEAFASGNIWLQLYLGAVVLSFFLLFWRLGGQTLGMRAWKIKLLDLTSGSAPSMLQLILRGLVALPCLLLGGIGLWWMLADPQRLAIHDRLSKTRLVLIPIN